MRISACRSCPLEYFRLTRATICAQNIWWVIEPVQELCCCCRQCFCCCCCCAKCEEKTVQGPIRFGSLQFYAVRWDFSKGFLPISTKSPASAFHLKNRRQRKNLAIAHWFCPLWPLSGRFFNFWLQILVSFDLVFFWFFFSFFGFMSLPISICFVQFIAMRTRQQIHLYTFQSAWVV